MDSALLEIEDVSDLCMSVPVAALVNNESTADGSSGACVFSSLTCIQSFSFSTISVDLL